MLQQLCVSTGGSTEFSTGPVFGRLRHRHPDSRLGLEGPEGSTLCCRDKYTRLLVLITIFISTIDQMCGDDCMDEPASK